MQFSWTCSQIQKFNFILQLICEIFVQIILHSDWHFGWGFWTITQKPDFFLHMFFFQTVKILLTLSYWSKKNIYIWVDKIFAESLKTSFLSLFEPSEPIWNFFQKPGFVIFLIESIFMEKFRKNLWLSDLALHTDGKINKSKFIGPFC